MKQYTTQELMDEIAGRGDNEKLPTLPDGVSIQEVNELTFPTGVISNYYYEYWSGWVGDGAEGYHYLVKVPIEFGVCDPLEDEESIKDIIRHHHIEFLTDNEMEICIEDISVDKVSGESLTVLEISKN